MRCAKLIGTRKHNGEEYSFWLKTLPDPCNPGKTWDYISVQTPENCFGYWDTVLLDYATQKAYTMHRGMRPSTLKAIEKQMIALGKKYNVKW